MKQSNIPLILLSDSQDKIGQFLDRYINMHNFLPYSIFKIYPLKKEITIDQIRDIKKQIITTPADKRLFIIFEFESAGAEAQNAFLKTLEEKTDQNQFVLIAKNEQNILSTIKSRAQSIYLRESAVSKAEDAIIELLASLKSEGYSFLSNKSISNIDREKALNIFDQIIYCYRSTLNKDNQAAGIIKKALYLKKLVRDNNLNPQLSVDNFLIFIKRILSP